MTKRIPCDVYSRVVGYYAPVGRWNAGKKQEFKDRLVYATPTLADEDSTPPHVVRPAELHE